MKSVSILSWTKSQTIIYHQVVQRHTISFFFQSFLREKLFIFSFYNQRIYWIHQKYSHIGVNHLWLVISIFDCHLYLADINLHRSHIRMPCILNPIIEAIIVSEKHWSNYTTYLVPAKIRKFSKKWKHDSSWVLVIASNERMIN